MEIDSAFIVANLSLYAIKIQFFNTLYRIDRQMIKNMTITHYGI